MINWTHLKAILWLRWRLSVNQWRKFGGLNLAITLIAVFSLLTFAVVSFFASIALGITFFPRFQPIQLMYLWDVVIGILIFSWTISLLTEVQRMEMLSLDKLLHLPLSLRDAFLLNYASSCFSLNVICFVPLAMGMSFALAYTHGVQMLCLVPMTMAFLLMLTAITYQFRGWLASMMTNHRRKRTVITILTLGLVAVGQAPNLVVQLTMPAFNQIKQAQLAELATSKNELSLKLASQAISAVEYEEQSKALEEAWEAKRKQQEEARDTMLTKYAVVSNQVLPIGWLPLSTKYLAEHSFLPLLCFLGMVGIGVASLRRAYASTIRSYTGQGGRGRAHANDSVSGKANALSEAEATKKAKRLFVSRSIPGISDRLSGVVLSNLINLIRAPETKMALIGPVIMIGVLMMFLLMGRIPTVPTAYGPLAWLGAIATLLFFCFALNLNIFGMDRDGFRSYVLMPVERHEILIGKNLSTMPLMVTIAALFAVCMLWIAAIGPFVFLATIFQFACGLTLANLLGNWVSILFPMALSPGTGKPVHINFVTVVVQVLVIILVPCLLLPGIAFVGLEWWVQTQAGLGAVPVYLLLSIVEMVLVWMLYKSVIRHQGRLLQSRETKILEVLSKHSE